MGWEEITCQFTCAESNNQRAWKIVGIFRLAGNTPFPPVFVNYAYLTRVLGVPDRIASLRVVTRQHDAAFQDQIAKQLQEVYSRVGIQVTQAITAAYLTRQNTSQTDVLVNFLLLMSVMIAIVGGFGLTSMMSMNVIQRTREIGVMRAIGASNFSIQQLVVVEGILVSVLGWMAAALLAIPLGQLLCVIGGMAFVQSPLSFVFSTDGFLVWLIMATVIAALASSLPARNAARITVREVLAYE